jgi:tripartite-type tricarboxylate transporter receptor subunit TctC
MPAEETTMIRSEFRVRSGPAPVRRRVAKLAALTLLTAAPWAAAQEVGYPTKPIRFVVPYPPGGGNDDVARLLSGRLGDELGQRVVVENRPGASGMIAGEHVARSAPDGYTIMIDHAGIVMNPALFRKPLIDVQRDLAPVTLAVTLGSTLLVHPSVPANNVAELIALAKAQPGRLNYASPGNGSPQHLDMELFKRMAGVDIVHVPYKGGAPATVAVLANEVQMIFSGTTGLPHVKSGKLRAIATTGLRRSSVLPEVPTVDESGLKGYSSVNWLGIFAPSQTPRPIIDRLNAAFVKVLQVPEVRADLASRNFDVVASSPEAFGRAIQDDATRYGAVIREFGIKLD